MDHTIEITRSILKSDRVWKSDLTDITSRYEAIRVVEAVNEIELVHATQNENDYLVAI
jgi:hypothetical protein